MMLFKLSIANIVKSFKDYTIYFFYVFNAIESQTVLLNVTSSTNEIIGLMTNILSGVSVFVSFILGFLIIYASRFLIKRRNKEFGVYLTLGMSKRKISIILFIETLIIGLLSLAVGLGLGVLLSQLMSLLVANMFDADMTKFSFIFSNDAFLKTLIYFGIMYLIVMFFNTFMISKCRLIELLNSEKKSEKVHLKNPIVSSIVFVISCIVLGRAYYMVTAGIQELETVDKIFLPIIMGSVSTFFIFWSLSGLILKLCTSIKSLYYRGLNSFILRQFSSKINTMVFSMTVICLMLFVTICILSSSLSIKNSLSANLKELAPVDIQFSKRVDYTLENTANRGEELALLNLNVVDTLKNMGIDTTEFIDESVEINIFSTPDLTIADTFGPKLNEILANYRYLNIHSQEKIISISEYNELAKLYELEQFDIESGEYIIIADFDPFVKIRNEVLAEHQNIEVFGHILKPKYEKCQKGFVEISSNHINDGILIVPDNVLADIKPVQNIFVGNYKMTKKEDKIELERQLEKKLKENDENFTLIKGNSKLIIAEASIGLGAMATFIGLYLGIIFLLSSAAILALKELSESADNKKRFKMLRKIGVDEHLINKALFRQIAIFFATPLILAVIHSYFGMKFSIFILETFGTRELMRSIIMTVVFLLVIYGSYFLITYFSSKTIIKERM